MRKLYLFILPILLNFGCSNTNLSTKQLELIDSCIEHIIKVENDKNLNDCFLINPYFDSFSLENYSLKGKTTLYSDFFLNEKEYIDIQKEIDRSYKGVLVDDLLKMSNCKESRYILSFSGMSDSVIFGRLVINSDKINKDHLLKKTEFIPRQITYFTFKFDNKYQIKNVEEELIIYD